MTGLLDAILIGGALSLLSGLVALCFASWQTRRGRGGSGLWRAARWAALAPLLLAPVIFVIPETGVAPMHAPLPDALLPATLGGPAAGTASFDPFSVFMAIEWLPVLVALYVAGLLVALAGAGLRHLRRSALLRSSRAAPDLAQDYLSILASRVGVEAPDFRLRDGLASPLLTGWSPVILAAPDLLDDTTASRYALTHELVHYRRGDEQDRLLGAALVAVLWFHWPLRRIERELHEAREIDCDAESLEALGGAERKPYAATLITMMRSPAQLVSAFGPDDRRHREMRIKAILSGRSARPSSRLLAVMLAGVSILPVACAQAAMTERNQLAVNLSNPAENHFVLRHVEAGADGDHSVKHDLHLGEDVDVEHDLEAEYGHDGEDGHMVFRTEDGNELRFDPREQHADESVVFIPQDDETETVIFTSREGAAGGYAFIDEDGNVTRFDPEPGSVWESDDGTLRPLAPPAAPTVAEPSAEPAPAAPASEPAPVLDRVEPAAAPRPDGPKRDVQPAAAVAPVFTHPVADGRISSRYGTRPSAPAGIPRNHRGTDIAAPTGTPIRAPGAGTVTHAAAGLNGSDAWGNTVVIDHGAGWQTVYAHMDGFDVEVGDFVDAGEQIGRVGSTGRSTGPHVHVELRHDGERIDPATRLPGLR
ncbi:M23/M56 family metallopeptidase [Maricaulis maris]|uniref:M23/M56 family metallopeptidase n=1 Tax=Maricaulis maris TaxID=74318 RepID=UPI0026EEAA11|nr:M23/M56 family metallopeptidase [Maricaulis maris]